MSTLIDDAIYDARGLRELTWGGSIPVDPVRIAHRLGLKVLDAVLDRSIPVALVKESGQDPQILLNAKDSVNRKRFSCAYALGCYTLADPLGPYTYVYKRGIFSARGRDAAGAFALALLTDTECGPNGDGKLMRAIWYGIPVETLTD